MKQFPTSGTLDMGEIIGRLFWLRDLTHARHLATRSYARHKALEEVYNELVELFDGLTESYQGKYGLVAIKPYQIPYGDEMAAITETCIYLEQVRGQLQEGYLQNQIDELHKLLYQAMYRLRYLA